MRPGSIYASGTGRAILSRAGAGNAAGAADGEPASAAEPGVYHLGSNVPQLTLKVDRDQASRLDVPVSRIFNSLQTAFGGTRAGDFSINNRVYPVVVQNEMQWRERAEQIGELYVQKSSRRADSTE